MNGDGVKLQAPVATTVFTNVPVDTAMLATNIYGPTTQLAGPTGTHHIPLIAATAAPQSAPHPQALQVAPPPQTQLQLNPHTHQHQHQQQTHLSAVQQNQQQLQQQQTQQQPTHQHQHQQQHLQYQQPQLTQQQQNTTATLDNTEYTVINGTMLQDGGTIVCYSQDDLTGSGTNLVAVEQMSGTAAAATSHQQQQQQIIVANGSQQHQQHQMSNAGGEHNGIPLEQLKQMLATQLEYYFSRFISFFFIYFSNF